MSEQDQREKAAELEQKRHEKPHGYLAGTHDEVERLREQYIDGKIDEEQLAALLTEQRLREHDRQRRRQKKAKRQWRLIAVGALLFVVVTFIWSQTSGVPI